MTKTPAGFCQCGCGKRTRKNRRGSFNRYLRGHNPPVNVARGAAHPNWNGGRIDRHGYVLVRLPEHHRASKLGYVPEHVLVAERALGKPLPARAVVHHINRDRADNRPENLVICEDAAYHNLLHQRMRALEACGNAGWLSCKFCHEYAAPGALCIRSGGRAIYHAECNRRYQRERRAMRSGAGDSLHPSPSRRTQGR